MRGALSVGNQRRPGTSRGHATAHGSRSAPAAPGADPLDGRPGTRWQPTVAAHDAMDRGYGSPRRPRSFNTEPPASRAPAASLRDGLSPTLDPASSPLTSWPGRRAARTVLDSEGRLTCPRLRSAVILCVSGRRSEHGVRGTITEHGATRNAAGDDAGQVTAAPG